MRCMILHEKKYWFASLFKDWIYFKIWLIHYKTRRVLLILARVFSLLWEAPRQNVVPPGGTAAWVPAEGVGCWLPLLLAFLNEEKQEGGFSNSRIFSPWDMAIQSQAFNFILFFFSFYRLTSSPWVSLPSACPPCPQHPGDVSEGLVPVLRAMFVSCLLPELALWEVFQSSWIQLIRSFSTMSISLREKIPVHEKGNLEQKSVGGSRVEEIGKKNPNPNTFAFEKVGFLLKSWETGLHTQHPHLQQPSTPQRATSSGRGSLRLNPQTRVQIRVFSPYSWKSSQRCCLISLLLC